MLNSYNSPRSLSDNMLIEYIKDTQSIILSGWQIMERFGVESEMGTKSAAHTAQALHYLNDLFNEFNNRRKEVKCTN